MPLIEVNQDAYDWFEKVRKKHKFTTQTEFLLRLMNMAEHYDIKFTRDLTSSDKWIHCPDCDRPIKLT